MEKLGMRREDEAEEALKEMGYEVIDQAGEVDSEGWGSFLGKSTKGFACLNWNYSSCPDCDGYEGMERTDVIADLKGCIEEFTTEEAARARFEEKQGW